MAKQQELRGAAQKIETAVPCGDQRGLSGSALGAEPHAEVAEADGSCSDPGASIPAPVGAGSSTPEKARKAHNNNRELSEQCISSAAQHCSFDPACEAISVDHAAAEGCCHGAAGQAGTESELPEDNQELDNGQCVVCWQADASVVLQPCGHLCTCAACTALFLGPQGACPLCRCSVLGSITVQT